ncbi:MAG: glycosyltransferase family 4 protein [Candidatus Obscuribacterales bacterium]|nr:glycosyltransferase family 4 protein [Candidatus Obscuribacterales bacterium]
MKRADQMTVSYFLQFLHQRGHKVDLFVLDSNENPGVEEVRWLKDRCSSVTVTKHRLIDIARGLIKALLKGWPLQVGYFYNQRQIDAVREACSRQVYDVGYSYYIRSAECTRNLRTSPAVRFLAMQLSQTLNIRRMLETFGSGRDRLIYSFEYPRICRYESQVPDDFDRVVLIGASDLKEIDKWRVHFKLPQISNAVLVPHGVDLKRFSSVDTDRAEPKTIVFSGVLRTNTNVHAICWFAKNVWPLVLNEEPDAKLLIVGRAPRSEVTALHGRNNIDVIGEVPDPAEYIARAAVCVNPVLAGAGMQNKLLEFMASGKPIVATPVAIEGIGCAADKDLLVCENATEFAKAVVYLLRSPQRREELGAAARAFVERRWSWENLFYELEKEMYQAAKIDPMREISRSPDPIC